MMVQTKNTFHIIIDPCSDGGMISPTKRGSPSGSPASTSSYFSPGNKNHAARQHKLKNCPICKKVLVASSLYLHLKVGVVRYCSKNSNSN